MANDYYNHGAYPSTGAPGRSQDARAEFDAVAAGFDKLPALAGAAYKIFYVNASGTGFSAFGGTGLLKMRTGAIPILAVDGTDYLSPGGAATVTGKTIEAASNNIVTVASGDLGATELNAALAELASEKATVTALAAEAAARSSADSQRVLKAGDAMTGPLSIAASAAGTLFTLTQSGAGKVWHAIGGGSTALLESTNTTLFLGLKNSNSSSDFATAIGSSGTSLVLRTAGTDRLVVDSGGRAVLSGDLEVNTAAPRIDLYENDGAAGYKLSTLLRSGDVTAFQTRDDSYVFVANDYLMLNGAAGVTEHRFYLNGVASLTLNGGSGGRLSLGPSTSSEPRVYINGVASGSAFQDGLWCNLTVQSDVTSGYFGIRHRGTTQAAAFTLPFMYHFYADQTTFGAGSTVTEQAGYYCANLSGGVTNYGFYGALTNVAGRWNFYAGGSAPNYFAGEVYVGQTSTITPGAGNSTIGIGIGSGGVISASRSGNSPGSFNREGSDGALISMRRGGSQVGSVSVTTTATAYNTSSDYRLKEITGDMDPAEAAGSIMRLRPRVGSWKADGSHFEGFVAHELQEEIPAAVSGAKDEVDGEGTPIYQGVDVSFIIPRLVAMVQEQQRQIQQLKAFLNL